MTQCDFEAKVTGLTHTLYHVSAALLPRLCDRQDAVQSSILHACRNRSRLHDERAFRPWIVRILINLDTDGSFSFVATFLIIGENEVRIRARQGGREAVLTHMMYYVPPADVYTRRAWAFERSDYVDLVNNIALREGQTYVCKGTIQEIISDRPQLAIMDTGTDEAEQMVLLENNSRTPWEVGQRYRIYGEASGLYETMPRLNVRYAYQN